MQLAIVTDMNKCVGCDACQMGCKVWNTSGPNGPMPDLNPWGKDPWVMYWLKVLHLERGTYPATQTVALPVSCFHCVDPACVRACPTGAMAKRAEDGIVLVDYDVCVGCRYCINACPYGNINFDPVQGIAKKCTLCVDRIYNEQLPRYERVPSCVRVCPTGARTFGDIDDPDSEARKIIQQHGGFVMGPEFRTQPANHYLPFRGPGGPGENWASETRIEEFARRSGAVNVVSEKHGPAKT